MTAPDVNADVRARFEITDEDVDASGAACFDGQWDILLPRAKEVYRRAIRRALTVYANRRADRDEEVRELVEAARPALDTINDYLTYEHNGDPWKEDARAMGEMDINDFARDGRLERLKAALAKFHPTHQEKP